MTPAKLMTSLLFSLFEGHEIELRPKWRCALPKHFMPINNVNILVNFGSNCKWDFRTIRFMLYSAMLAKMTFLYICQKLWIERIYNLELSEAVTVTILNRRACGSIHFKHNYTESLKLFLFISTYWHKVIYSWFS
jgi:hypothetical protein